MNREDWTLLALDGARHRGLSPVQLQKILFILGKEFPSDVGQAYYQFMPYHYGPFDPDVYRDAETLSRRGLATISPAANIRFYSISEDGRQCASQIKAVAPPKAQEYLAAVVAWAQSLTFGQLVKSVYAKYPETSVNSVFRG